MINPAAPGANLEGLSSYIGFLLNNWYKTNVFRCMVDRNLMNTCLIIFHQTPNGLGEFLTPTLSKQYGHHCTVNGLNLHMKMAILCQFTMNSTMHFRS